ncbi:MAG: hypothetical protein M3457_02200 [Chloroflexota bacterium]|nr:hypothetical protein [Chloroflexota bacterium]
MPSALETATHIAAAVLRYQDNLYTVHRPMWGDDEYTWRDGNYSCDCNRLQFIVEEYPNAVPDGWKEEDATCGDDIALVFLSIRAIAKESEVTA